MFVGFVVEVYVNGFVYDVVSVVGFEKLSVRDWFGVDVCCY